MSKKHKKAVGYIRVSTSIQAKEGESLSTQRQQIVDFAKNKGWELVHIYEDKGITGAKIEDRNELQNLIEDAKQGKFDVTIFTKLSRFARNTREYLNLSHQLEEYNVTLVSIKENFDPTTTAGRVIATMFASFAEWEHDTIREQMFENKMARWREHRIFNGKPPYAYYWNKQTKQLEINEEEAKVYHLIVDMYLEQKMSFQDICIKLKKDGIKGKRKDWTSSTLSYLLKNPAYYGKYIVNQYQYEDGPNGAGTRRTKKRKPSSEYITFKIPPLISKNQWDRIQKQTEFNKCKSKRSNRTEDLIMRDVLICGRCGGRVKPRIGNVRKDGTAPRYYCCYWAGTSEKNLIASGRDKKCSLPYIKTKDIENAIWVDILIMYNLNKKIVIDNIFDSDNHKNTIKLLNQKIDRLEAELKKKNRAKDSLFELLERDELNLDDLTNKIQIKQDEIFNIESDLEDTRLELKEQENSAKTEKDIEDFIKKNKKELNNIAKKINKLSADDRKLLVESMLKDKVIVDFQEDNKFDGPGGTSCRYKLKWNPHILQRFVDERKITILNTNSTHDTARYDI